MRYQGRITSWKDDQGYGFITPNEGGEPVFVHVKSLTRPGRRPAVNDVVTYTLTTNDKGQTRADEVAFAFDFGFRASRRGSRSHGLALGFIFLLVMFALGGKVPAIVLGIYLLASVCAFIVYAQDKSAAQNNSWRTRESTLHALSLAGGWPGALMAQRILQHKTSKASFQSRFWLMVVLNVAVLLWLLSPWGARVLGG